MKNTPNRAFPTIVTPSKQLNAVILLRKIIRKGLIIFDFETTGLHAKTDRIVKVEAIKIKTGHITDTFRTYVNNKIPIPEELETLTGITNDDVKGAPNISEALQLLSIFTSEKGYVLSSYNSSFEKEFLSVWDFNQEIEISEIIDLLAIAKTILKGKVRSYSLMSLRKYYGISPDIPCPRLTAEIILAMANEKKR